MLHEACVCFVFYSLKYNEVKNKPSLPG